MERTIVTLQFVFDYRSPYSYLANRQLGQWTERIEYRPVDVVDIMARANNQLTPLCPPKARYALLDAKRWAMARNIPFSPNQAFLQAMRSGAIDGASLSRMAIAAQSTGVFSQVNDALFEAVWAGRADLVSREGRAAFLEGLDVGGIDLWQLAQADNVTAWLSGHNDEAVDRGVFGVPTIFVGDEMFFGNDRIEFARAWLQALAT
jgi:2-hydroxychromene-2-carboxylate isomerase